MDRSSTNARTADQLAATATIARTAVSGAAPASSVDGPLVGSRSPSSLPDLEFYFVVGQLLIFAPAFKLPALKEQIEGDFQEPPTLKNVIQKPQQNQP